MAVRFDQRGGDVFAWSQPVSGRADCPEVALQVNGRPLGDRAPVRGGRFAAVVPLAEGRNQVVGRCPDAGDGDPATVCFTGRLRARPTARIDLAVDGATVTLDAGPSEPAQPDGAEVVRAAWSPDPAHPAPLTTAAGQPFTGELGGPRLALRAPAGDGEYHLRLTVTDAAGRTDSAGTYFVVTDGKARAVDPAREHPRWIDSAVVYAPVPDLWGDDGPAAVERHLGDLQELGVDALWLWPPASERAPGQHYAITDYFRLDPSWGPPAAFRSLVDAAHGHGLRVLLDVVPNHLSVESPYFRDARRHGPASRYWGFFDRDQDGRPTHYFDWDHLPNLDYDHPEVRRMVTEAFSHWVRELEVDGFRVDAAWGVQRRRPDFWPGLRQELKRIDPDLLLLAEASATDPWWFGHGFDAAFDWTDELGHWAWAAAFDDQGAIGPLLAAAVTNQGRGYAPGAIVLRFLNNNDTGERFVDRHGPGCTRVAATLQFTVPGMPALFAGDEVGASYLPYSDLAPIPWDDPHGLRPHYRRLIELKHRLPALHTDQVEVLAADPAGAFAFLRPAPAGAEPVLVVCNFGGPAEVALAATPGVEAALAGRDTLADRLGGRPVRLRAGPGTVAVAMAAQTALVLTPEAG